MAYLRSNRYQLELVQSVRKDGKPRTVVLHRFQSEGELSQLRDPKFRSQLEKKGGTKLDAVTLLKRGHALWPDVTGKAPQGAHPLTRSMQTTRHSNKKVPGTALQVLKPGLPVKCSPPKEWSQYAAWRRLLPHDQAYAQACVAIYEFSFLYRYGVLPVVHLGRPMLKVQSENSGTVIFPLDVLLLILSHGAAITQVMFSTVGGAQVFWEDAGVSCKTFAGEWLSVSELAHLNSEGVSLEVFSQELILMRKWLKAQNDVAWAQEALHKVSSGRMRRETLRAKLIQAGAKEAAAASFLVWEKSIYGLGPMKSRKRSRAG